MMDVFDSQPPTKLHNLDAAIQQQQQGQTPMTLPSDYSPRDHDICCGRGKRNWNHKGNVYFRNLIQANVDRYITGKTKTDKTAIVLAVVDQVRLGGSYFVKQNDDNGRWYDIGDAQAREKVGHSLRDQVTAMKKNSKKSDSVEPVIPVAALSASAPPAYAMQQQPQQQQPPQQKQQPMGYPYSDQQPNLQYANNQYQNPFPNYTDLDNVHSMTQNLMHRHLPNEIPQTNLQQNHMQQNFSSDYSQQQQNSMINPMQQLSTDYPQQQQQQQQQNSMINPMQQLSADYSQQQQQNSMINPMQQLSADYSQQQQQKSMINPMQQLSADYPQQQQQQQQQNSMINPMQQLSADYPQQQQQQHHQQQQNHLQQQNNLQHHITADYASSMGPPETQNNFPRHFSSDDAQYLPPQRCSSFSFSDQGGDHLLSDVRHSDSTSSSRDEMKKFGRRPSWRAMSISATQANHMVDEMHQLQNADFDTDDDDFEDVKNFIMSVGGPSQGSRRRSSNNARVSDPNNARVSDPNSARASDPRLSGMSLAMSLGSVGSFSDMASMSFSNPYRSSIRRSSVAWMKEMNDQFVQFESQNSGENDRKSSTLDMLKVLQDVDFDGL
jgi:hypothetical protein